MILEMVKKKLLQQIRQQKKKGAERYLWRIFADRIAPEALR